MGDDENFDLDDELGLGDDDDGGGDDFGDSLDDMLDDDDSSEGGGDGGLDAFFEDLSNIDEMEGGEAPEPQAAPAAAAAPPPPQAQAAPVMHQPPPSSGGGGSKMKWIIILLLLLGAGGGGYWWWLQQPPEEFIPPEDLVIGDQPSDALTVEPPPLPPPPKRQVQKRAVVPPPPPVTVEVETPPPMAATPKYLVQVGTCAFSKCRDQFADELRRAGHPVYFKSTGESYDFIEVVTKQLFKLRDAQDWVDRINQSNERGGVASIVEQGNGYRVSAGTFTSLDRAKSQKLYLESLFPSELKLNMEHVKKRYETIKIFAGPYSTRSEAQRVRDGFRKSNKYRDSFLVRL